MPNDRAVTKRRTAFVQLTFSEKQGPIVPACEHTLDGYFNEHGLESVLTSTIKNNEYAHEWIKDVKVVLLSEGEA